MPQKMELKNNEAIKEDRQNEKKKKKKIKNYITAYIQQLTALREQLLNMKTANRVYPLQMYVFPHGTCTAHLINE